MTRKNYIAIANVIKDIPCEETKTLVTHIISNILHSAFTNFNATTFKNYIFGGNNDK